MRYRFLYYCYLLLSLVACKTPNKSDHQALQNPWIIRSVLDHHPRMLTVAMDTGAYLAYDASLCGIRKVWKGGVYWEGAAFSNVKTVQPTSWGHKLFTDSLAEQVWKIFNPAQEEQKKKIRFGGYYSKGKELSLKYFFDLPNGDTIKIKEEPSLIKKQDSYMLIRNFSIKGLPKDWQVSLNNLGQKLVWDKNKSLSLQLSWKDPGAVKKPTYFAAEQMGSRGRYWLDRSGCNTCHEEEYRTVGPSYQEIADRYENTKEDIGYLIQKVKKGGAGNWGVVAMIPHTDHDEASIEGMIKYILSLKKETDVSGKSTRSSATDQKEESIKVKAGFGKPLDSIHPSYDLHTIRKRSFQPRVGAMDFLSDDQLLVTTWDSIGGVYLLSGVNSSDTNKIEIKRIAAGLAEPLGLKVVDGNIFVLQKQELTQLIDHDQDDIIDEYKTICATWGVTEDFHEFSYGLVYKDGYFYANLGLAMRLMSHEEQHKDRGRTIKIGLDGQFTPLNFGLRQPNGIGFGTDNELFITENQGRWIPANKLIHVQEEGNHFYGSRAVIKDSLPSLKMSPPAVWLPQDEIANSPGQAIRMEDGPYVGQIIYGDVTHGGLKRIYLEKINHQYQGAVFRFSQGLEAGINRLCYGPDGALYVGGVGMNGNWGWKLRQYGLQKMVYNGKSNFEILKMNISAAGFDLKFTEALADGQLNLLYKTVIKQWWYLPGPQYGGPKMDPETLTIHSIEVSGDRKSVHFSLTGIKQGRVVYVLLDERLMSSRNQALWTGEAWYTVNSLP